MPFAIPTSPIGAGDLPAATTTAAGIVTLAESGGTGATTPITGTDLRIADTVQAVSEATLIGVGIDWASGRKATVTLTADRTVAAPLHPTTGAVYHLIVVQDGTGNWELTFPANFLRCPGPFQPAAAITCYKFVYDGTNYLCVSPRIWRTKTIAASGAHTVTAQEFMTILRMTSTSAWSIALPAYATNRDFQTAVSQRGAGVGIGTVADASGNINGQPSYILGAQYETATFIAGATEWGMM